MTTPQASLEHYCTLLNEYERTGGEAALYQASLMSEALIQAGLGPEDITALHFEAIDRLLDANPNVLQRAHLLGRAHQFLLEVMINYGVKYKEYIDLRLEQSIRRAEEELERERAKAEDAARAEREKLEILGSIAHEMATPLTAARGNVAIAHRLLIGGRVSDVNPVLDSTQAALSRLSRLTADLMHASRGQLPDLTLTRIDLVGVLKEAASWARIIADEKHIEFECHLPQEPVWVRGNVDSLLTLAGNLLSNAMRYTPSQGRVELTCDSDHGEVLFRVRDTGIGISKEDQEHIFGRFYRSEEARKFAPTGLGLGLAMCAQIADLHGAAIELESTPGEGSTFTVRLACQSDE